MLREDRQDYIDRMQQSAFEDQMSAHMRDGERAVLNGAVWGDGYATHDCDFETLVAEMRRLELVHKKEPDRIVILRSVVEKLKDSPDCELRDASGVSSLLGVPLEIWDTRVECFQRCQSLADEGIRTLMVVTE